VRGNQHVRLVELTCLPSSIRFQGLPLSELLISPDGLRAKCNVAVQLSKMCMCSLEDAMNALHECCIIQVHVLSSSNMQEQARNALNKSIVLSVLSD